MNNIEFVKELKTKGVRLSKGAMLQLYNEIVWTKLAVIDEHLMFLKRLGIISFDEFNAIYRCLKKIKEVK